ESFAKWWPADLHVVGKDINRFHTVIWPAMLMSAGLPLPRKVWVHGWLLTHGERMSKSRGNFLEPGDVVNAFGRDGARYVTLREVAFDKDTEVSWDSFLRRYNADLANDLGNLINRSISMTNRYLQGERPMVAAGGALGAAWPETFAAYAANIESYLLHEALATLWRFVGAANRNVDAQQPWVLAKAAKAGDAAASATLRDVLAELLEACRVIVLVVAPFMPDAAVRILGQLGHEFPYGADGNGGPSLAEQAAWGACGDRPGNVEIAAPIFPRQETEPAPE
ncbi:MAG: class I tRNA ligase family protein, partial [Chloroflexi bacterium]|nr:class I tRNA ligase family protein [Chloroflexota bacterium]